MTTSTEKVSRTRKKTSTKKVNQSTDEGFILGDTVVLGLKGIYRIENKEKMSIGDFNQVCYVLTDLLTSTIHKTYLPIQSVKRQARLISKSVTPRRFEKMMVETQINPEEFENNSNKKIMAYEERILEKGFKQLIESYQCVKLDLEKNTKSDKRFALFRDRLKTLIISEISISNDMTKEEATNFFEKYDRSNTTQ